MNCTQIQELLPEYSLGLLTEAEAAVVDEHLAAGCYHCEAMLDELGEAAAIIPLTDPTAAQHLEPPAELKDALMQRVQDDARHRVAEVATVPREDSVPPAAKSRSRWKYVLAYAAAAAIAFVVGSQFTVPPQPLVLSQAEREQLYQERMAQIQQSFDAEQVRLATATRSANQPHKQGAVVWDHRARQVHLFAFDLPATESSGVLQAWVVDEAGACIPIGLLEVDQRGDVAQAFTVPRQVDSVHSILVTLEPEPAASTIPAGSQPPGEVRLVAPFEPQ